MTAANRLRADWLAKAEAAKVLEQELAAAPPDGKAAVRIRLAAAIRAERSAFHRYSRTGP